jgi:hypothetical protein
MLDGLLWTLAKHEAAHALYGARCGFEVYSLRADADGGATEARLPFPPVELRNWYDLAPLQTRSELQQSIGMIVAPSVLLGEPTSGTDRTELHKWGLAWRVCRLDTRPAGPPFLAIEAAARGDVVAWLRFPGVRAAVHRLATALAARGALAGRELQAYMQWPMTRPPKVIHDGRKGHQTGAAQRAASTQRIPEESVCLRKSGRDYGGSPFVLPTAW